MKQLEPAAAQPALVVLHNIARVVRPLPADMRAAVQPLLQVRHLWEAKLWLAIRIISVTVLYHIPASSTTVPRIFTLTLIISSRVTQWRLEEALSRLVSALQLLRRQWQAAPASSGAAARVLAYSAAADAEIAAVLRRADAIAVATPMLAASVPPHLATGAAALVEDVVR